MKEENQEEIKITDRRHFHPDGTPRPDVVEREETETPHPSPADAAQPESGSEPSAQDEPSEAPTFLGFLMGLVHGAASHLGLVPHPVSGKTEVDLQAAKQMIDLLGVLQEKTKGNLTPQEEQFLQAQLTELRLVYVRAESQQKPDAPRVSQ